MGGVMGDGPGPGDHVDQDPEERQHEDEQHPARLRPPGKIVAGKDLPEHHHEHPDEQDPEEEHQHGPQDGSERPGRRQHGPPPPDRAERSLAARSGPCLSGGIAPGPPVADNSPVSEAPSIAPSREEPGGKRRRPSGEPPPLPRTERLGPPLLALLVVLLMGVALTLAIRASDSVGTAGRGIQEWFADHRSSGLTNSAKALYALTSFAGVMTLRVGTVVILVLHRRFRHMVVFLATLVLTDWFISRVLFAELPRPTVTPLISVDVYSFPSKPLSVLAITLFAAGFVVVPRGPARRWARVGFGLVLGLVIVSGLYLATEYLTGSLYG